MEGTSYGICTLGIQSLQFRLWLSDYDYVNTAQGKHHDIFTIIYANDPWAS